jgi:hypothetical protein
MKLRRLTIALSMVGASSVGLVGCGGSSNNYPEIVTRDGRAVDGFLSNAYVCVDVNRNRVCDSGEPSDTTDSGGNYSIQTGNTSAPLVLESLADTFDVTNNEAIGTGLFLTAPNDATVLSPLTTLAQIRSELSGESYSASETAVIGSLGLSGTVTNLSNYDYISQQASSTQSIVTAAQKAANTARVLARSIKSNLAVLTADTTTSQTFDNAASVYGLITTSTVENIANTVNSNIDNSITPDIDAIVTNNTVSSTDLVNLATTIEQAAQADVTVDTSGVSGSGGGSI